MVDDIYFGLKEVLDKVNRYEEDYYQLKSKLIEAEIKLALKKSELINSKKITGRNDMFREAQVIQWAANEYKEVKRLQKELLEIQSKYYPMKREWEFFVLLINNIKLKD